MNEPDACKIVVYVPESDFSDYIENLSKYKINRIGDYVNCLSWAKVTSTWTPVEGAHPYLGNVGKQSVENELRVEMLCDIEQVPKIAEILRKFHPYEEPEIDMYPIYSL